MPRSRSRVIARNVAELRGQGVQVLLGEGDTPPPPGSADRFPWQDAVEALPTLVR